MTMAVNLKPGCYVKKRFPKRRGVRPKAGFGRAAGERLWVKVTKITKTGIEGTIANDPVVRTDLKFGKKVKVRANEIIDATCQKAR